MEAILDRLDALLNFGVIIGIAVLIAVCSFAFGQIVADKTTDKPMFKPTTNYAPHIPPIKTNSPTTGIGLIDEFSLSTVHHCIYIGEGATGTNNYELVITFTDGTEIRQMLPTNKTVNLPWMK